MVTDSRKKGILFGVGLLLGVAAGAVGMMSLRGGDGPYASSPLPTRSMGAAPASTAFVTAVSGNCELAPLLNAGAGDGQETLQARPDTATAAEVASLILSGKEAAAAGRQRDAEIDFLNACRNAAALGDGDPLPLADAMYQLGRHYANAGAFGSPKAKELYQRSERLYSASLEGYRARYGEDHEKTRFAREGLTTVQQATGGKAPVAIAKAPPQPAAPAPEPAPAPVAAAPAPAVAAAASAPAPVRQEVAKAPPEPPRASASQVQAARRSLEAPDEGKPVTASRSVRPPEEQRSREDTAAQVAEPPRPRAQARSTPPRDSADNGDTAAMADVPPPPRRRPAPVVSEAQPEPPSAPLDLSSSGAGAVPSAEGSPNAP